MFNSTDIATAPWEETQAALEAGERLSAEQGLSLFSMECFHDAGRRANAERERRHGAQTFYNINCHLNYSNICSYACRLCAFGARKGDPKAWELSLEQAVEIARNEVPDAVTELHIVGGAHPDLEFSFYVSLLRGLKAARPGVHLKAFSAVEIHHFAKRFGMTVRETLQRLIEAGLDSLPGGGAEIFAPRVRRLLCPDKASAGEWLAVHREAHRLGLKSNATILYGHIETPAERVDHLLRLRALQDETGGFQAIIPLKFHPENTALSHLPLSGGILDLQMMAACRLILDNFPHVKAYWPSLGLKTAQAALWWGADDLDGTVVRERIYHTAAARSPVGLDVTSLRALIAECGREPVERDSLYYRADKESAG